MRVLQTILHSAIVISVPFCVLDTPAQADQRWPEPIAIVSAPAEDSLIGGVGGADYVEQVAELVNQERWDNGQLPPLKLNALLNDAADTHSTNMAERDFFAHCDLDTGDGPGDRISDAGYNWSSYGENIAAGYSTPESVMSTWMQSSGHRNNILSTTRRELGVGYVYQSGDAGNIRRDLNGDCVADSFGNGPYSRYWTQVFGRRGNVYPVVINREAYETDSRDVDLYIYGSGWAQEMRLRNENGNWSAWGPFASETTWELSPGSGISEVFVELRNGGSVLEASDTIVLDDLGEVFSDGFESGELLGWEDVL